MEFLTTQKKLAEKVGCTEVHLSKVKARKVGVSEDLAVRLSSATAISAFLWAAGPKLSLKKKLREFFQDQRILSLAQHKQRGEK